MRSGYRITPVVALLQPGFALQPDSDEVEEVFELPLAFALASCQLSLAPAPACAAASRRSGSCRYGARNIWGATAGMLVSLRETARAGRRA